MTRKIGINLLLWTDDPTRRALDPLYERLAAMGFDGVELPIFDGDPAEYRALAERLDALGLERTATSALDEDHDPASPVPEVRARALDRLTRVIDCCAAVGAPLLGGPLYAAIGRFTGSPPTAREIADSVAIVARAADHAATRGVALTLEFLNRFETYLLNTTDAAAAYVDAVDRPNVSIHYDTFHAHIEESDAAAAIVRNAHRIGHVHVSENHRGVPGTGQVHWRATFDALDEIDYRGWLTIESFGQTLPALAAATKVWRPLFDTEDALAEQGLRFVRAIADGTRV